MVQLSLTGFDPFPLKEDHYLGLPVQSLQTMLRLKSSGKLD
jgi:hypothetical protein